MEANQDKVRPDKIRTLGDYVAVLRRRWVYPAVTVPAVMLIAIFLAFALPPMYRSTATIMLEPSSIPADLVRSTVPSSIPDERTMRNAVVGYADSQFDLVRRRVLARSKLEEVVKKVDPYPDRKKLSAADKASLIWDNVVVERVDPITLEPLEVSTAFSIHYDNPRPEIAATIAEELAGLFLAYNTETRVEQATETYNFLKLRAEQLRQSVGDMETRLAAFKRNNPAALPEDQIRNQMELDRSEHDVYEMQSQLRLAEQRQSALEVQLAQISPSLVGAVTDPRTELATLKAQLADAERRYTPDHPVVKRLRRSIETLANSGAVGSGSATVRADNPEYLRVAGDLESARRDTNALKAQVGNAFGEIGRLRRLLAEAPTVEQQYVSLTRDVQVARDQLQDTEKKMRDAELASQMESEQKGERYTMIRAPYIPEEPHSPNRLGLILLGAVLAFGLGIGLAAIADVLDPTVRNLDDVRELLDQPVLATVGVLMNAERRAQQRHRFRLVAACFAAATAVVVVTVARALLQPEPEHIADAPADDDAAPAADAASSNTR